MCFLYAPLGREKEYQKKHRKWAPVGSLKEEEEEEWFHFSPIFDVSRVSFSFPFFDFFKNPSQNTIHQWIRKQKTSDKMRRFEFKHSSREIDFSKFSNLNSSRNINLLRHSFFFWFRLNRTAHVSRVPQNPNSNPQPFFRVSSFIRKNPNELKWFFF